jgi:hypothetical protein
MFRYSDHGGFFLLEDPMKRVKNFSIKKESFEEMNNAGRYNPCITITFRDRTGLHTHNLSSGYEDNICVYREAGLTCVLSKNERLGYIGLQVFDGDNPAGHVFFQGDQVIEILGKKTLAPFTMIRRLMDFIG